MTMSPQERAAVAALGGCLAAHLNDDRAGTLTAMDQVMAYVHADGESIARARLSWLTGALAEVCGRIMVDILGDPATSIYGLAGSLDESPEPEQVALTAVVTHMNGDSAGAAHLLRHYAADAGSAGMADVLGTLVSVHTGAERKRPTGTEPEEHDTPENTHGEDRNSAHARRHGTAARPHRGSHPA